MHAGDDCSGETQTSAGYQAETNDSDDPRQPGILDEQASEANFLMLELTKVQIEEGYASIEMYKASAAELSWRCHLWQALTKLVETASDGIQKSIAEHFGK